MKKIKEYFNEIADSLETNIELWSLCKIGIIRVQSIKCFGWQQNFEGIEYVMELLKEQ